VHPALRAALHQQQGAPRIASAFRLTVGMLKTIEVLRHPPVAGPAQGLWYQGKALEVMAECFFAGRGSNRRDARARRKLVASVSSGQFRY